MRKLEFIMGMPVIVEITNGNEYAFKKVFNYFKFIDQKFSPFKPKSEVTQINKKRLKPKDYSEDMLEILRLAELTKKQTNGYFNVMHQGKFDPSGIVKGWAIYEAAKILDNLGFNSYYIDAGGDIQTCGKNWTIGIRNPFNKLQNIKVVTLNGQGIATSGTYEKGDHIYNPLGKSQREIISLTVIAPNVYEADRFATPAFIMGKKGIQFIEKTPHLEGYMIDNNGIATMTSGFDKYVAKN